MSLAKLHKNVYSVHLFVSNICTLGLAMVGLAFLSVTLNGSKPDIVLSTTPLKLALIFVHMYFAWGLFASVKWAWAELNKTVHSVYMSSAVCTVLYSYLAPPWPQYCQPITEDEYQKML